jgi:hypothetical protein
LIHQSLRLCRRSWLYDALSNTATQPYRDGVIAICFGKLIRKQKKVSGRGQFYCVTSSLPPHATLQHPHKAEPLSCCLFQCLLSASSRIPMTNQSGSALRRSSLHLTRHYQTGCMYVCTCIYADTLLQAPSDACHLLDWVVTTDPLNCVCTI